MPITERTVVVAASDQVSTALGGEAVILELKRGVYFGLNEVGASIWQLLAEPRSVGEIRDAVSAEFDVAPDRALEDLLALLAELQERGLVEVRGGAAP